MCAEQFRPTVVIVDDDAAITECVAHCLNKTGRVQVVDAGRHAQEGVALAVEHQPDVVLLDIHMPGADAFWACQEIRSLTANRTRVLFYTSFPRDHYLDRAIDAGASGVVSKHSETMESLVSAIRHVARGATYYSPELARRLVALEGGALRSRLTTLAHREVETLRLMAAGKTNREISQALQISLRSVEKAIADMKKKLDLNSTNELMIFAARENLICPKTLPASDCENCSPAETITV